MRKRKEKNTNGASVITYHRKTRINWRNSWVSCFCYHFFVTCDLNWLYLLCQNTSFNWHSSLGEWVIVWNYSLVFFASIGACVAESLQFFAHNLIVLKKYFISVCTPNCLYVDIVNLINSIKSAASAGVGGWIFSMSIWWVEKLIK